MDPSQISVGGSPKRSPMRWIVTVIVLGVLAGGGAFLLSRIRQDETPGGYTANRGGISPSKQFPGSYKISRDPDGRVKELCMMEPTGELKLRVTIAYSERDFRIQEISIFEKSGALVESFIFEGDKHNVRTQQPPPGTPPPSISATISKSSRVWECDGFPLFRERFAAKKYEVTGPDGAILFSKDVADQ